MDIDTLLNTIGVCESSDLEFKSAQGGFPHSFWPTYSGMGNTNGGTILFGVKETSKGLIIEGLAFDQVNTYQKILWDTLNNPSKVNKNILSSTDVRIISFKEAYILSISVPRARRSDSPIYIGASPFGNTYRRSHEGDYHCSDEQVRRMLADSSPIPADQRILRGFALSDLDPTSIEQYRQRFASSKPNHPWLSLAPQQFLQMLGGWRKDRESGEEGITLAGLLMFGCHHAIFDVGGAPLYFVDYREKLDLDLRWNHRICPDGTWEPNLFQFYQRIWPHLSFDLKIPFHLDGIHRIDDTSVHKALREALVNALIHADYSAPGGVIIERYHDRFILDNPGSLLVSYDQLRRGGISECRNQALQKLFMMIGGGEKAGSGVHHILNEWKNQHWRAPTFSTQDHPDRVRLILPMIGLFPQTTLTSLELRLGQKFTHLTKLEKVALATADIEGEVSNIRLQELETEHPTAITQTLQNLCAKNLLISDKRRRWSRYRIPNNTHFNTGSSPLNDSNSPFNDGNSPHNDPFTTTLNAENSPLNDSSSPPKDPSSPHKDLITPTSFDFKLTKLIAEITNKKRVSPKLIEKAIIELCKTKPLTLNTLSQLLNRKPKSLQNSYVTRLLAMEKLKLQYPTSPNHPEQAYITKSETQ